MAKVTPEHVHEEDTGIYKRQLAETPEGMVQMIRAAKDAAAKRPSLDELLAGLKESAYEIVEEYAIDAETPPAVGMDASPTERDAAALLRHLIPLRRAMDEGNMDAAVEHAIALGRIWERSTIRWAEPKVARDKTLEAGRAKGTAATKGNAAATPDRIKQIKSYMQAGHTRKRACELVSIDEKNAGREVKPETLRKATNGLKV